MGCCILCSKCRAAEALFTCTIGRGLWAEATCDVVREVNSVADGVHDDITAIQYYICNKPAYKQHT